MKKNIKKALIIMAAVTTITACSSEKPNDKAMSEVSEDMGKSETKTSEEAKTYEDAKTKDDIEVDESEKKVNAAEIYKKIEALGIIPEMFCADDEFISNYYGIDLGKIDSYVAAFADDPIRADSVVIFVLKNEEDIKTLKDELETIKEAKAAEMRDYVPEQFDIVEKSEVKSFAKTVYLVISEDMETINDKILESLK